MAYVPGFLNDIFISYAHIDNEAFGGRRWVDEFHEALRVAVQHYLGARPVIWRDPKLSGNDVFSNEIEDSLKNSAIFLPILSPGYLNSAWCRSELDSFVNVAGGVSGLRVENKTRLTKVVKTPVERESLPRSLRDIIGYKFFEIDEASTKVRDYLLDEALRNRGAYLETIDDIAQDIAKLLKLIAGKTQHNLSQPFGVIYLAEATSDVDEFRKRLKRELQDRSYLVLPDESLPTTPLELEAAVEGYLSRADLYVQLFGDYYGTSFEQEARSRQALQYDVAKARFTNSNGALLWRAPESVVSDQRQREFLDRVVHDLDGGFDFMACPLEELKSAVLDRFKSRKAPAQPTPGQDVQRIYLVCDESDKEKVRPLRSLIDEQGFEPLMPSFNRKIDPSEIRQAHLNNVETCDAMLIYWGEGDEDWLQVKLSELRKAPAIRKGARLRASGIYIADPPNADKQIFNTREANILRHGGQFSSEILNPFLAQLRAGS